MDLARRRIRSLGRRHRSRPRSLDAVRIVGVRGHSRLQHAARTRRLSARGSPPAAARLLPDLSDGRQVLARRTGGGHLRGHRAQQRRRLLRSADGPPRLRRVEHGAVRQPGRSVHPVLAVGRVPRRRRVGERRRRVRLELAPRCAEHDPGDGEDGRQLSQRPADQDGGAAQRLRRRHRAQPGRYGERGLRPERVPRPQRHDLHVDGQRHAAPRHHAQRHSHAGARRGLPGA